MINPPLLFSMEALRQKSVQLFDAVDNRNYNDLRALLTIEGIDVNIKNAHGFTPLMHAARSNDPISAQLLLDTGSIRLNAKDNMGVTARMWAATSNSPEIVRMINDAKNLSIRPVMNIR